MGIGIEANVPLHAVACWNGRNAYEAWGLNDSHVAFAVLAIDATRLCTRTTGPDGTLRFTYHTTLRPALLPFLSRDVRVGLVLDRNGNVVHFP